MMPEDDGTLTTRRETDQRERWNIPIRCSVCTRLIWFCPIALKEPVEAPEPRQEWILCKHCHQAFLVEMGRSPVRSPARLRIAMGLVAAERSPVMSPQVREQQEFEREFAWAIWFMISLALTHLVIFVILIGAPR